MVKEEPHIFLVAAEDIEVGAELLFDYGIRYWTIRQCLPSLIIILSGFQWPFVLSTVKLILLSSDKEYIKANPWIVNTWSCVISTLAAVFDGDINFVLLKLFRTDIGSFSCNHAFLWEIKWIVHTARVSRLALFVYLLECPLQLAEHFLYHPCGLIVNTIQPLFCSVCWNFVHLLLQIMHSSLQLAAYCMCQASFKPSRASFCVSCLCIELQTSWSGGLKVAFIHSLQQFCSPQIIFEHIHSNLK